AVLVDEPLVRHQSPGDVTNARPAKLHGGRWRQHAGRVCGSGKTVPPQDRVDAVRKHEQAAGRLGKRERMIDGHARAKDVLDSQPLLSHGSPHECGSPPPGLRLNVVRRHGNWTVAQAWFENASELLAPVADTTPMADVETVKLACADSAKKLFDP